ncbi:MAG: FAD-dependent oxidoreductase [Candidatus Moraniibacteriota bacterium]
METLYDTIIIGGGPGGVAAGVYAARKRLKTLFITRDFNSQSAVSAGIENWIGTESISGWEFAQALEKHLRAQESIEIKVGEEATGIERINTNFHVKTAKGEYAGKTLIIASGGRHRHLDVPGEEQLNGRGVAYCSTCDAPFFKEQRVAVVGGGNAGLEAVEDLLPYAKEIVLLVRSGELKGDPITQEKVKAAADKVSVIYQAEVKEIQGDGKVSGIKYLDKESGQEKTLEVGGVFVEIGVVPNTEFVKDLVETNERGEIVVDGKTAATNVPGIFATGDATDLPYKQNNISAGLGVAAALSAYDYLRKQ